MIRKTVLAIAVFASLPTAHAAAQIELDQMRAKSLAYLVSQQKGDGSWRDASGNGVQATASALEAMTNSGIKTGYVPGAAVSWLMNENASSTDSLARQIAALARHNVGVNHLVPLLMANKNLIDGRWGAYKGYQASMPDTALAFDALLAANTSVPTDAQLVAITGMQATDGGWPYRVEAPGGAKSAVIPTAYAVLVLSRYVTARASAQNVSETHIADGISWLLARKKTNGGFAEDAAADGTHNTAKAGHTFETALVQTALAAAKQAGLAAAQTTAATQALTDMENFLVDRQSTDGSWSGDPFQAALTARALPAVTLADADSDGLPDAVEPYLNHNVAVADSRDLPKGNGNPFDIAPTTDWDRDGVMDQNEVEVGTDPFKAASKPWLRAGGEAVGLDELRSSTPEIAWQTGWHLNAEDFDHDGDTDLALYFNGANENVMELDCSYDCVGGAYTGPEFGVLVYLENVAGTYVRRSFSNGEDIITGDVQRMTSLDFDNDNKTDLLLVLNNVITSSPRSEFYANKPYRRLVLMKNDTNAIYASPQNPQGVHFIDVTSSAGLTNAKWYAEGLVVDLNRDGYQDIVATTHNGSEVTGDALRFDKASGTYMPVFLTGLPSSMSFTEVLDLNNDGRLDIVESYYPQGLRFFSNNGDLTFTEWPNTHDLSNFGGAWLKRIVPGDMNNDGLQDLVLIETVLQGKQYAGGKAKILHNLGVASNQISIVEAPIPALTSPGDFMDVAYGGAVGDLDNDGNLDVMLAGTSGVSALFHSDGSAGFARLGDEVGLNPIGAGLNNRYAEPVFIDLNDDGKADLLSPTVLDRYSLLLNTGNWNGTRNSIAVELAGRNRTTVPSSGKDAYGARVEITANGRTITQQVVPGMGKSRRLHFGLGDASSGIQVRIFWPHNPTPQAISGDAYINSILRVNEP